MINFIKGALSDENKEQLLQEEYVKEAQLFHGARAYAFVTDYQRERYNKQAYVEENVSAQGHDLEDFLACLAKEKGLGPNVDFFSLQEIEALAKKFKESQKPGNFEANRGAPGVRYLVIMHFRKPR